jgi:hypothetical protein
MISPANLERLAQKVHGRKSKRLIATAREAGVPLGTILEWLLMYGPKIFEILKDLINNWKKDNGIAVDEEETVVVGTEEEAEEEE